jgi:hypothetical protein
MAEAEQRNAVYAAESAANRAEQEQLERASERSEQKSKARRQRRLQEAMYAKSGVLLDGTPSNYLTAQAETDELNVQRADQISMRERINTLYEGDLQKAGHLAKANSYEFAAASSKAAAKNTLIGGAFKAIAAGVKSYASASSGGVGAFSWSAADAGTSTASGSSSNGGSSSSGQFGQFSKLTLQSGN